MGLGFTVFLYTLVGLLSYSSGGNFSVFWNAPTQCCKDRIFPQLRDYGIQFNDDYNFTGETIALFYEFTFGRYPYYKDYNISIPINNGTPQRVDEEGMKRHIKIAKENITKYIPNKSSSGLGIIDFEEWRPLFDINSMKKQIYKDEAVFIANETKPELNATILNKTAAAMYDKAAKEFILYTINNATEHRNQTKWGMYGFPYCNYDAGTNESEYRCKPNYRNFNDRMTYIFNASQALYPSIYLNNASTPARNFRYVQAIIAETLRVARNYTTTRELPIYAYTKYEYDPLKQLCSFYTKEDLCSTIVLPYVMGVDGLIFWSSSRNMTQRCNITTDFVKTTLGPLVQQVIANSTTEERKYNETSTELKFEDVCSNSTLDQITTFLKPSSCNVTTTNQTNPKKT